MQLRWNGESYEDESIKAVEMVDYSGTSVNELNVLYDFVHEAKRFETETTLQFICWTLEPSYIYFLFINVWLKRNTAHRNKGKHTLKWRNKHGVFACNSLCNIWARAAAAITQMTRCTPGPIIHEGHHFIPPIDKIVLVHDKIAFASLAVIVVIKCYVSTPPTTTTTTSLLVVVRWNFTQQPPSTTTPLYLVSSGPGLRFSLHIVLFRFTKDTASPKWTPHPIIVFQYEC